MVSKGVITAVVKILSIVAIEPSVAIEPAGTHL